MPTIRMYAVRCSNYELAIPYCVVQESIWSWTIRHHYLATWYTHESRFMDLRWWSHLGYLGRRYAHCATTVLLSQFQISSTCIDWVGQTWTQTSGFTGQSCLEKQSNSKRAGARMSDLWTSFLHQARCILRCSIWVNDFILLQFRIHISILISLTIIETAYYTSTSYKVK